MAWHGFNGDNGLRHIEQSSIEPVAGDFGGIYRFLVDSFTPTA
jgi:hypothetical protein